MSDIGSEEFIHQAQTVLAAVKHADISIHSGLMLAVLERDGKMLVGEVAEKVGITQQAVGKALKVLALHDEVTITINQADRRAKNIEITNTGLNCLENVIQGMA